MSENEKKDSIVPMSNNNFNEDINQKKENVEEMNQNLHHMSTKENDPSKNESIEKNDHNEEDGQDINQPKVEKVQTYLEQYEEKTAGFWIRFWAFIVDVLIVGAIVGLFANPIFYLMDWDMSKSTWYAPMSIISAVFYYGYFIIMTKIWQQTLGKMIFGLKVKTINGEKLTWLTVIFREFVGRFISNKIPLFYLMVVFMPKNQGLQDFIADTYVIHEKVYVKNKVAVLKEIVNKDSNSKNSISPSV